jgi:hypothetical protein
VAFRQLLLDASNDFETSRGAESVYSAYPSLEMWTKQYLRFLERDTEPRNPAELLTTLVGTALTVYDIYAANQRGVISENSPTLSFEAFVDRAFQITAERTFEIINIEEGYAYLKRDIERFWNFYDPKADVGNFRNVTWTRDYLLEIAATSVQIFNDAVTIGKREEEDIESK